ncbi:MAG: hypothetical protein E7291_09600 [Lachnospiraceae bacterium]|nr:hypothetical protein [Lachnospiraceae bacterium]
MDTFMDKLAQKLNAQEMIRANSAADAAEMGKLKNQIEEYNECLGKLQELLAEGEQKFDNVKVDNDEVNRLVMDCIAKIDEVLSDTENIEDLTETVSETVTGMKDALRSVLDEMKSSLRPALEEQKTALNTMLDDFSGNVHKECVKVYRNVQAMVVEENEKQAKEMVDAVNALGRQMKAIMGISIAALVVALGGVAFQLLVYFHIL